MLRTTLSRSTRTAAGLVVTFLVLALVPAAAEANAALRLYPDIADGGGGQLVGHTPFTLTVVNDGNGGGDNTAYGSQLAVAVPDPGLLTGVTLIFPDASSLTLSAADLTFGSPAFPCSGRLMPPHGVYPAAFATVPLGDIAQDESVNLTIDYSGLEGLAIHFDAFASGLKNNGDCQDVYNPFGHDVTAIVSGGGTNPPECEVEVDKTSNVDAVELGEEAVFTIIAENVGDCELTMTVITDVIPVISGDDTDYPAFSVIATDPPATSANDTEVVWEIGTVAAGSSATVTMTVLFDEPLADGHEVINAACLAAVELDEDPCDNATVAVGVVPPPEPIGGPGFWCRQIRAALDNRHNARYTIDQLETWLSQINSDSWVFTELRDTTSLELVRELICRPNTLVTAGDRLMRHLMTLWFNIVAERVNPELTLGELCAGDEDLPEGADPAWTVDSVRDQTEAALIEAAADQTLLFWKDVIDFINNGSYPDDCERVRRMERRGRLRP